MREKRKKANNGKTDHCNTVYSLITIQALKKKL